MPWENDWLSKQPRWELLGYDGVTLFRSESEVIGGSSQGSVDVADVISASTVMTCPQQSRGKFLQAGV